MTSLLADAGAGAYAVGYFESWNLESLQAVIDAAEESRSPVIVGFNGMFLCSPQRVVRERLELYAQMSLAAARAATVPVAIIFNECDDDDAIRAAIDRLMPVCHQREVAFIVNDRPDLAAECGADGAHIGADDGDYASARALLGGDAILGVSCYDSRHLAMQAGEAGADYVAFGAFYPTQSKTPRARAAPEIIAWWHDLTVVQCVAIGGIAAHNCGPAGTGGGGRLLVEAQMQRLALQGRPRPRKVDP